MKNPLAILRGLLPGPWRPSSRGALAFTDIREDGFLVAPGGLRAVLRLPTEGLDGGEQTVRALSRLAAAINTSANRATLLAWGRPHTLAGKLQERQERATRFAPGTGRHDLAISQATHLGQMVRGRPATADRPAKPPVRRTGFYLVIEESSPEALDRLAQTLCALYGAVRCSGAEAANLEADAWRGLPLPPRGLQIWTDASETHQGRHVEMYVNKDGAHVRTVNDEGYKIKELAR